MATNLDNYKILYADAPYMVYEENSCIATNFQFTQGDRITSVDFIPGDESTPDVLNFVIEAAGVTTSTIVSQMIQTVTQSSANVTIQLNIGDEVVASDTIEYGKGTLHDDSSTVHIVNYIAAPYDNKENTAIPKSAYVIVNMPVYDSDNVFFGSFDSGKGIEPDLLTLHVTSKNIPTDPRRTFGQVFGPFMITNLQSTGVEVQVAVNNTPPVKSPLGKKSYGQDEIQKDTGNQTA